MQMVCSVDFSPYWSQLSWNSLGKTYFSIWLGVDFSDFLKIYQYLQPTVWKMLKILGNKGSRKKKFFLSCLATKKRFFLRLLLRNRIFFVFLFSANEQVMWTRKKLKQQKRMLIKRKKNMNKI